MENEAYSLTSPLEPVSARPVPFRAVVRGARREQTRGYSRLGSARLLLALVVTLQFVRELNERAARLAIHPWNELNAATLAASFVATVQNGGQPAQTRELASYGGQVVLVHFWSFSCMACANTLRDMELVHGRLASEGLRIVSINVDDSTVTEALRSELAYRAYATEMATDSWGHGRLIQRAGVLPWMVLYDRAGNPRRTTHGLMPDRVYSYWLLPAASQEIRALLAEPLPSRR